MSNRNDFTKELKRLGRELTGKKNELEMTEKKKPEIKEALENAGRLYETVIAETGEARPELLGETERLEKALGTCEATINGLARYVSETLPSKIAAEGAKLRELDIQEGQKRHKALLPEINRTLRKLAALLRESDEISFSYAYAVGAYDETLIPIGNFGNLSSIPKYFVKAEFGGPVLSESTRRFYWTPGEILARKVISGEIPAPDTTSETIISPRKTLENQIGETETALDAAQKRIPGLIANRDAANIAFAAMPEMENSELWKAARQAKNDCEKYLELCRDEIRQLENKLAALKADAAEDGAE
jgi:chromosome segregation ATPase